MGYWRRIMRNAQPHLICEKCKKCDDWVEKELCLHYYYCTKYGDFNYRCKRKCKKLRKGMLKRIKQTINDIKE